MEGNLIELLTLQNYGNRTRPILVLLSKEFFFSTFDQKKSPFTHSNTLSSLTRLWKPIFQALCCLSRIFAAFNTDKYMD